MTEESWCGECVECLGGETEIPQSPSLGLDCGIEAADNLQLVGCVLAVRLKYELTINKTSLGSLIMVLVIAL